MIFVIWFGVALAALVLYLKQRYSKLAQLQLNHQPTVPLLGNMSQMALRQKHMADIVQDSYNAFPEDRIVGYYEFLNPILLVKDPELLKNVTVKDFEHFVDRKLVGEDDSVFGRNLLLLKGDVWKDMRSTLSPAFTSAKIRHMVPFMLEVGDKMRDQIQSKIMDSEDGYVDLDVRDLATRFANDVIATCAFGLQVNSQKEDNAFYVKSKQLTTFTIKRFIRFVVGRSLPALAKKLRMKVIPDDLEEFFSTIVLGTMKQRERHSIIRNDMIHLLMEAKKGSLAHDSSSADTSTGFATVEESNVGMKKNNREWTDKDLVAQALLFLLAGFETVSTAFSFLLHELALDFDIQDRLLAEIKENDKKNGGKFDYNSVQSMVYLDMVISETLRLWPPAPMIDRQCVKDYNAGRPNTNATKDLIVRKGQALNISVFSFHRDPKYFPEPTKFDPERFSEENRHKIKPFTYMPFGLGPRNCIGSRFALCELKVMVYQLLKQFQVSPCPGTCIPSELAKGTMSMRLAGGHRLRLNVWQPKKLDEISKKYNL